MATPEEGVLLQQNQQSKQVIDPAETQCGVPFLQRLASKKSYVLCYGFVGMTLFGLNTYRSGTVTTLEKQFKISSRTSGVLASASDMSAVLAGILLAYFARTGHKPRWVGAGVAMVAISCALRLLPYVLYGSGEDVKLLTLEYGATPMQQTLTQGSPFLCGSGNSSASCIESSSTSGSVSIMFIAQLVMGIGQSVYYTLGVSYLDDNVSKNKAPILIGITQCMRLIGPTFGSLWAAYCLSLYVEPHLTPTIKNNDPRWIGAWWLGWIPFTLLNVILAVTISMFPKTLPREAERRLAAGIVQENPEFSLQDFIRTMKRLLCNKVLMFNSLAQVFYFFGMVGFWFFKPKYMETQFYKSTSTSNLVNGSIGLLSKALGVLVSTSIITRYRPRTRLVTGWNVFVETLDIVGSILYTVISCPGNPIQGNLFPNGTLDVSMGCNEECRCPSSLKYSPVCESTTNSIYFSACHAGCTDYTWTNVTTSFKVYSNCSCAEDVAQIQDGPCPVDCDTAFIMFLVVACVKSFFSASGRAGNTLIHFRCVDPVDKPVAIGIAEFMLSLFAFIPAPIFFGIIIDWTCKVWGQTCDGTGNCWLYDDFKLRTYVNVTSGAFLAIGTLLDVGVWYYSKDIQLYEPEETNKKEEGEKKHKMKSLNE